MAQGLRDGSQGQGSLQASSVGKSQHPLASHLVSKEVACI